MALSKKALVSLDSSQNKLGLYDIVNCDLKEASNGGLVPACMDLAVRFGVYTTPAIVGLMPGPGKHAGDTKALLMPEKTDIAGWLEELLAKAAKHVPDPADMTVPVPQLTARTQALCNQEKPLCIVAILGSSKARVNAVDILSE
eukprot:gene16762-19912_t